MFDPLGYFVTLILLAMRPLTGMEFVVRLAHMLGQDE